MRVRILNSEAAIARAVAARVRTLLAERHDAVLGLPTGRTPVQLYAELSSQHRAGRLDFSGATTFNLDEFLGLPASHPASYRRFMESHLFSQVNLSPTRIHFLNGMARSPEEECARYEREILKAGGLDLLILGIGANGHIGFNEPAAALVADAHRARLASGTRRSNSGLFGGRASAVPAEALSMGVGTILRSRSIILMATGESKESAIRGMLQGPVTPRLPASFLQLHGDVEIVMDRAAARGLE